MSITPLTFTGISQFSSDFQVILNRAVSIASLPMKALQNEQADLLQKKQLATNLGSAMSDLSAAVSNLGTLASSKALAATSSDPSAVAIQATNASAPASYTINVTSVAKAAAETSDRGYATADATAVSANGSLQLTVGSTAYPLTLDPAHNNLNGLRDAINALGAGVTASVLTTGTGATPNYLSITANMTGATTLALADDPAGARTALLTSANQGANARLTINGAPVSQAGNLVNSVVPGVSFSILNTTASPATISVQSDRTKLSAALSDFAAKYNAVKQEINGQIGPSAGLLSGNPMVLQSQAAVRALVNYNGSAGSVRSLAALGIGIDKTGKMSFEQAAFNSLSDAQIADGFAFLGSTRTGFGALAANLDSISDPATGLVKIQSDQFDAADRRISDQVDSLTQRIDTVQQALARRLQSADALLAQLQSQQSMLTASVESLNFSTYGYQQKP